MWSSWVFEQDFFWMIDTPEIPRSTNVFTWFDNVILNGHRGYQQFHNGINDKTHTHTSKSCLPSIYNEDQYFYFYEKNENFWEIFVDLSVK